MCGDPGVFARASLDHRAKGSHPSGMGEMGEMGEVFWDGVDWELVEHVCPFW